jgi:hypothetical protein
MTDRVTLEKDGHWRPATDNAVSLCLASRRWLEAYAVAFRTGHGDAQWLSGTGSPESVVTAKVGSLYSRLDGGAGTTLYVKQSGTGNTGWVAK